MTVSSTATRTDFAGNDVATSFPCNWKIFANTDIEVILRVNATSVETPKTLTTDYTVSIAEDYTFTVSTLFTPATGETLTIRRNMSATQETDYEEGGAFQAESHENALDKVTMLIQQLKEEVDRCVKLAKSSSYSLPELPDPEDGKALIWSSGDLVNLNLADVSLLGYTDFWKAMLLLSTAAASRSALSVYSKSEVEAFTDYFPIYEWKGDDDSPPELVSNGAGLAFDGTNREMMEGQLENLDPDYTYTLRFFGKPSTSAAGKVMKWAVDYVQVDSGGSWLDIPYTYGTGELMVKDGLYNATNTSNELVVNGFAYSCSSAITSQTTALTSGEWPATAGQTVGIGSGEHMTAVANAWANLAATTVQVPSSSTTTGLQWSLGTAFTSAHFVDADSYLRVRVRREPADSEDTYEADWNMLSIGVARS